ncbi:MAG: GTP 3',8-cyclase MoaA [Candidatus Bathyarchaeota archaeon]|nr:MAG: GTP 3',8-cyclase MoaA [Candidatus Bathyarchaeota archaeon]
MIRDAFGRPVNSLRVSVTQKCNFNCFFCHREGVNYNTSIEMTPLEIERIVKAIAPFGINNVKLTGGEPLLRNDILEIIKKISSIPLIREIAMTTNGLHLDQLAKPLKDSGLKRVNVNLCTLKPTIYKTITGTNQIELVLDGIKEAGKAGLSPIKVNMVVLKGVNEEQIWDMIDFARKNGLILQLIEFESPTDKDFYYVKYHTDLTKIETELTKIANKIFVRKMQNRKKFYLTNGVEVEIVKPMHNTEFCRSCNKMRISSDGKFKPCLFRNDNLVDFLKLLRKEDSDEVLKNLFLEAISNRKPYFIKVP